MALLQKKVKKTIRVGDYLKKAKYANQFLWNVFDAFMMADGYFLFKRWGKGNLVFRFNSLTTITGGTMKRERARGARFISLEFDDSKTPYGLKVDILTAMQKAYKDGYWTKGKFKDQHEIYPSDVMDMKIAVESKHFLQ